MSSYYYYEVDVCAVGLSASCEQVRDMLYLICLVDGYVSLKYAAEVRRLTPNVCTQS